MGDAQAASTFSRVFEALALRLAHELKEDRWSPVVVRSIVRGCALDVMRATLEHDFMDEELSDHAVAFLIELRFLTRAAPDEAYPRGALVRCAEAGEPLGDVVKSTLGIAF